CTQSITGFLLAFSNLFRFLPSLLTSLSCLLHLLPIFPFFFATDALFDFFSHDIDMTTTVTVTVSQASTTAGVQKQRTHLMRSTRKLGSLLGETPLIIDNSRHEHTASMSSMASRRSGMIFLGTDLLALPPPSPDGLKSVESSGAKMDRPMLFLRRPLPTLLSTAPSPQSPSFPALTPTTPLTPETVVVDRRKKMAKLTRTLGVNPPAELVFRGVSAKEFAAIPSPHYVSSVLAALGPANSTVGSRASMMSVESLASPTREATLLPYRATAARSASSLVLSSPSGPWVNARPVRIDLQHSFRDPVSCSPGRHDLGSRGRGEQDFALDSRRAVPLPTLHSGPPGTHVLAHARPEPPRPVARCGLALPVADLVIV
ncbi:unnamed protein product, partial [Mycena citricolor]